MNWFMEALRNKYATFEGRARRKEYWNYVLFYCLALIALSGGDRATTARHRPQWVVGPDRLYSHRRRHRADRVHGAGQPAGREPVRAESEGVNTVLW
jgi:hypothetical protein